MDGIKGIARVKFLTGKVEEWNRLKSPTVVAALVAAQLAACNGPRPADNGQTAQPPAVEQANVAEEPTVNQAINEVGTADPAPAAGPPESCEAEIGKVAATELARRCRSVSPATHPPCHPANSCEMIQSEIDRSCAMFGDDQPAECKGRVIRRRS